MTREVLFTGSVPREPARAVFETLQRAVGDRVRRMPDGEQRGWLLPIWEALGGLPVFEPVPIARPMTDADSPFRDIPFATWRLREGATLDGVGLDAFGSAESTADSYRQFRELKVREAVAPEMRMQATVVGPATAVCPLEIGLADALALVEPPLSGDVRAIGEAVPHDELTIQFDLAVEPEMEEWRRRPTAFGETFLEPIAARWDDWSLDTIAESVARIAEHVPPDAELGFHLCGMWHIDPRGGQDMQVHVDLANALVDAIGRRIDYIHVASVPEHGPDDYAKLAGLRLDAGTKLFVGLIHHDGQAAAERRLRDAAAVVPDVGVAHFCGMAPAFRVEPEDLDDLLELHARVAADG